jgi:cytochrome P450
MNPLLHSSSINANAYKLCFWILAYILHRPSLLSTLRAETSSALVQNDVDMPSLLSSCPHLDSVFNEVLRLTNSAASIRTVESPTILSGKTLRPGTKVLSAFRQLHFDEEVFGDNALHFDADRFLKNKDLARSKSYRPFGGGTTYCPGRFVARQEVYMFVAVVLRRFDIGLAPKNGGGEQVFPVLDRKKPSLGVMGPVNGDDVLVSVRPRDGLAAEGKRKS